MQNKQKLIIILGLSMIMASSIGLLTQKITLENYYKEKFEILINRVIPKDQYLVNVDIKLSEELREKDGSQPLKTLDNKTSEPILEESDEKEENVVSEEEDFFDLFGNNEEKKEEEKTEKEEESEIKEEFKEEYSPTKQSGIESFNISVYLDPSISTKQTQIQEILCESVYLEASVCGGENCECISFNILDSGIGKVAQNDQIIEDSGTNENVLKEYELLIDQMRDDREREEAERISKETKKLEKELKSIENLYESLRIQNKVEDSTKLAYYERKDRNLQRKRDSLLVVLEDKTEKARIAYYQQGQDFQQRQFDVMMELVKMKNGNGGDSEKGKNGGSAAYAPRPPYENGNSSSLMMILILIIVLAGFIGMFFAIRQKPKPVYLKPKTKNNNEENKENKETAPVNETNSTLKQNNDVIKSEVKSLRQSAVSMSVGQKEAATKILEDWLDEPTKETNQDESEKEE